MKMCDNVQLCQQTIQNRQRSIAHNHHVQMIATDTYTYNFSVSVLFCWLQIVLRCIHIEQYFPIGLIHFFLYSLHIVCRD